MRPGEAQPGEGEGGQAAGDHLSQGNGQGEEDRVEDEAAEAPRAAAGFHQALPGQQLAVVAGSRVEEPAGIVHHLLGQLPSGKKLGLGGEHVRLPLQGGDGHPVEGEQHGGGQHQEQAVDQEVASVRPTRHQYSTRFSARRQLIMVNRKTIRKRTQATAEA